MGHRERSVAIFAISSWIVDYHASRGSARNDSFLSRFSGDDASPSGFNPGFRVKPGMIEIRDLHGFVQPAR